MNSMQILWHELGNSRAISADVTIHPNLCGFTWTDHHRPQEIMERRATATGGSDRTHADMRLFRDRGH
jgi:hypothetical protein